ncbi:MAG: TadE/TadG family type IV pilus assembly protein [Novosphingobium sp.]
MGQATPFRHHHHTAGLRLRADASGSVAVEFAMLAPLLLALIFGVFQAALLFLTQQGLETAAESAARLVVTGQAQKSGLTSSQFRTAACAGLPPYLSCSNLYTDVTVVSSYSAATLGVPTFTYDSSGNVTNGFAYNTGGKGAIVVLRVMYLMPVMGGPGLKLSNQANGTRLMTATAVFKNEIYS